MTNPELAAACAAVPEIKAAEELLQAAKELLAEAPYADDPTRARDAVLDEAADAFVGSATWPKDVARRAAKAYDEAEAKGLERHARQRAVTRAEWLLYDALSDHFGKALEFLGKRLNDVLSDARSAFEALRGANSAEAAIEAGGDAVEAWSKLRTLTRDLERVRQAQWALLKPPRVPGGALVDDNRVFNWTQRGYGHVRGLDPAEFPSFAREAVRTGTVTRDFLRWTASQEAAYVPTSAEEIEADIAASLPDVFEGEPWDVTPAEFPDRPHEPSKVFEHSQAPHIDGSQPAPAKPTPNATPGEPTPARVAY